MYNVATKHLGFRARFLGFSSRAPRWQASYCGLKQPWIGPRWTSTTTLDPRVRKVDMDQPKSWTVKVQMIMDRKVTDNGSSVTLSGSTTHLTDTESGHRRVRKPVHNRPKYGSLMPSAPSTTKSVGQSPGREQGVEPLHEEIDGTPVALDDFEPRRKETIERLSNTLTSGRQAKVSETLSDSQQDTAYEPIASESREQVASKERWPEYEDYLTRLSTSEIMQELRVKANRATGEVNAVRHICRYLIQERDIRPNLDMFSALISMNVHEKRGSARAVRSTLYDMSLFSIELDVNACHDILRVMAVHPDYLMIIDVLEYMQTRWFELNDEGHRNVVLGFLRSAQYELALERLDAMLEQGINVQPWLFDVVIYNLCAINELDEVLRILQIRSQHDELAISLTMWAIILDTASAQLDYQALSYVWDRRVRPGYLHPQDGVCLNVMIAAARAGDVDLATEVFSLLSERDTILKHHHYEVLLEAYLTANDMRGAIALLCIMQEARIEPDAGSTRVLFEHLLHGSLADRIDALKALQEVRNEDDKCIPLIVVNTLIESHVRMRSEVQQAVNVYKVLHTLVKGGPDALTFNLLLEACAIAKNKDLALSLASEMPILKVAPNGAIYKHMIAACLSDETSDGQDALGYYHEARAHGYRLNLSTLKLLVERLLKGDEECVAAGVEVIKESTDWTGFLVRDENFQAVLREHGVQRDVREIELTSPTKGSVV